MKAIYKNELRSYFTSMTGYVFVGFMLLFAGIYTLALCLRSGFPSFEYVLANMSFVFFIIVPVITMKVLSEEKRQKTDQLLYSLPITTTDVVLGKYFALLTVLAVPLLIMAFYPLILSLYGNVYLLTAYGALLGFFFMGAAFLAIGLFISSVTESQMIAAGLCFVVLLLNYFITQISGVVSSAAYVSFMILMILAAAMAGIVWLMTRNWFSTLLVGGILLIGVALTYYWKPSLFEGLVGKAITGISLFNRFYVFVSGSFNLTEIVFFVSVSVLFIFLSVQSLEKRRWS